MKKLWLLAIVPAYLAIGGVYHWIEKRYVFDQALRYARSVNKPILNYGCGQYFWYAIKHSDVNADIVPRDVPNFMLVEPDTRKLPFPDKYFSCAFVSHVIEHVENPDALLAELNRVADRVYIITPKPIFLQTWLNPSHKWVFIGEKKIKHPFYIKPSGRKYLRYSA